MGETTPLPGLIRPAGRHEFTDLTPPLKSTTVTVALDRRTLDALTEQIDWGIELSNDGGLTWLPWGGASTVPGQLMDAVGQVILESSFTIDLPFPATDLTRVRGALTTQETSVMTLKVQTQ